VWTNSPARPPRLPRAQGGFVAPGEDLYAFGGAEERSPSGARRLLATIKVTAGSTDREALSGRQGGLGWGPGAPRRPSSRRSARSARRWRRPCALCRAPADRPGAATVAASPPRVSSSSRAWRRSGPRAIRGFLAPLADQFTVKSVEMATESLDVWAPCLSGHLPAGGRDQGGPFATYNGRYVAEWRHEADGSGDRAADDAAGGAFRGEPRGAEMLSRQSPLQRRSCERTRWHSSVERGLCCGLACSPRSSPVARMAGPQDGGGSKPAVASLIKDGMVAYFDQAGQVRPFRSRADQNATKLANLVARRQPGTSTSSSTRARSCRGRRSPPRSRSTRRLPPGAREAALPR